jgi:hypothetical protein
LWQASAAVPLFSGIIPLSVDLIPLFVGVGEFIRKGLI